MTFDLEHTDPLFLAIAWLVVMAVLAWMLWELRR